MNSARAPRAASRSVRRRSVPLPAPASSILARSQAGEIPAGEVAVRRHGTQIVAQALLIRRRVPSRRLLCGLDLPLEPDDLTRRAPAAGPAHPAVPAAGPARRIRAAAPRHHSREERAGWIWGRSTVTAIFERRARRERAGDARDVALDDGIGGVDDAPVRPAAAARARSCARRHREARVTAKMKRSCSSLVTSSTPSTTRARSMRPRSSLRTFTSMCRPPIGEHLIRARRSLRQRRIAQEGQAAGGKLLVEGRQPRGQAGAALVAQTHGGTRARVALARHGRGRRARSAPVGRRSAPWRCGRLRSVTGCGSGNSVCAVSSCAAPVSSAAGCGRVQQSLDRRTWRRRNASARAGRSLRSGASSGKPADRHSGSRTGTAGAPRAAADQGDRNVVPVLAAGVLQDRPSLQLTLASPATSRQLAFHKGISAR